MAEYIDREELLQDIHESIVFSVARSGKGQTSLELKGANKILDRIKSAPTVDVVEVVRCKDCKHYKTSPLFPEKQGKYCYKVLKDNGIAVGHGFKENDYCSYGERKCEE